MYADDTTLLVSANDLNELMSQVNRESSKVLRWLKTNKLMVNKEKTKYMILNRQARNIPDSVTLLLLCYEPIVRVSNCKFQGFFVDCNLKFDGYIESVVKKLVKYVPICYRLSVITKLYNGFVLPNMRYCISVWGALSNCAIKLLQSLHSKIVKSKFSPDTNIGTI